MAAKSKSFRLADYLIVALCLSGAAGCITLFVRDLYKTYNVVNRPPVGSVVVKFNTVQRRLDDRLVYDRLVNRSPVYDGDLIRVADRSGAELEIDNNYLDLKENTLIRIQSKKGPGPLQINVFQGSLNINSSAEDGNIVLYILDNQVEIGPGTELNAAVVNGGMMLQVNSGEAELTTSQGAGEAVTAGTVITLDTAGRKQTIPAVVVTHPPLNMRYLMSSPEPLHIGFTWNRFNFAPNDTLSLEIASDWNFDQIVHTIEDVHSSAQAALGAGLWYWRLSHRELILHAGRLAIIESSGPALISPAADQLFRYHTKPPEIFFQWSSIAEVSHYILEAGKTPDFENPLIQREIQAASIVIPNLELGRWYWRVRPVFPAHYEGSAGFSSAASFRIEQSDTMEAPALRSPAPDAIINTAENQGNLFFSWERCDEAAAYTFRIAADKDLHRPLFTRVELQNYCYIQHDDLELDPGEYYYWAVSVTNEYGNQSLFSAPPRPFRIPGTDFVPAPIDLAEKFTMEGFPAPPPPPEAATTPVAAVTPVVRPPPVQVRPLTLESPAAEAQIEGLTALRQQTVFRWNSSETVGRSRFVLSRNANPLQGRPAVEIRNPGRTVTVDRLGEGVWYWTVEAQTPEGRSISAARPRQLRVLPIPLLPVPENQVPPTGFQIGGEELRTQESLVFRWAAVEGANAYIFSFFQETDRGRRRIVSTNPESRTSWTLDDFSILDEGMFVWQVEAVYRGRNGAIEQRGRTEENIFIVDIPEPGRIETGEPGVLYGY
ncbi:MAG: hypothetical protein FWD36_06955 [Treponema sp.]|nr:hypothetical protein [Treponema sp.]